jgi:predicted nucleic acid-binding Zn ribbon protein
VPPEPPDPARDPGAVPGAGADAARAALSRARAAARARGLFPGRSAARGAGQTAAGRLARARLAGERRSGAGPDARDPQPVGSSIDRLVVERGWETPVAVGGVLGRWDQVVGGPVAAHCAAESFDAGVLVVRTDSTAWATQVRLLAPTVLRRLAEELGEGVVERLVVRGPAAPSWHRGPRTAPGGRGPRDTYS